jgi:hypothetical protein
MNADFSGACLIKANRPPGDQTRERKPSQYPRNPRVIRPIRVPTAFLGQAKPDPATGGGIIAV